MRADIPGNGPIEFEGHLLPEGAKQFAAVTFLHEISPEIRKWILDLRYSWARERSAPSSFIVNACNELEDRIYRDAELLQNKLSTAHPNVDPAIVCQEWLSSIVTMRKCAETKKVCTWTMRPLHGEVSHFLGVAKRLYQTMVATQNAKRPPQQQIPNPTILNEIDDCPEDEQIAFINAVVDGMSD